ncbi:MAG TPA: 8-amino-7-oxononanoate synthase [Bryobacteraceae bacterium]|jgi:8-amino-7-oxononanoate synthase|nr:8-amino-7-oxononanoate synthase [Bryobacteraceae bacterium]
MAASELERRLRAQLNRLDTEGLRRSLRAPSGIDFSSNDYLGLSSHPALREAMAEAVAHEGCGSTGSRLLRGEREAFSQLERRFARLKGTERALYFSSGYLANLAVLSTFAEAGDVIYSDQHNHASLIDGARLSKAQRRIFPHNDAAVLAAWMDEETAPGQKFVVTESLFSMDGDIAPLAEYSRLARAHGAALIVDDAHAVGIYGPDGAGLSSDAWVSVSTAGKALGVCGAFVAGPEWAIETLIQRARPFIFSTAAPPAVAAALEASLNLIEGEPWRRTRLLARAAYLRRCLAEAGITVPEGLSQIIPLVIGDNQRAMLVAQALQDRGFDARAIRPPSVPDGTARLRLSVNTNLSELTLDRFVDALAAALKEYAACCAASS